MSSNANAGGSDDGPTVGREVAYRLFAAEYDDASLSHAESDEERAPNYVITPTGARVNRLFAVGTLTEVTPVNEEMVRARVVDPTGAFVVYAGQYQPEALAFLERAEPPLFVAVTGKARTFEPEDGDRVYTSIRPESIATVDADTRDRWVVETADQTVDRIATYAAAAGIDANGEALEAALREAGVDAATAAGIPLAQGHYGTTPGYLEALRTVAIDAVRVVAGERDQVGSFDLAPGQQGTGAVTFADLASTTDVDVDAAAVASGTTAADETSQAPTASSDSPADAADTDAADTDAAPSATAGDESTDSEESASTAAKADATDDTAADGTTTDDASEGDGTAPADGEAETTDDAESAAGAAENGDLDVDVTEESVGMYEMDDEERAELEEQFGAEFTTGAEVEDAGEADVEAPEPSSESAAEPASESAGEPAESADAVDDAGGDDLGDFRPSSGGLESVDEADAEDDVAGDDETGGDAGSETEEAPEADSGAGTEDAAAVTDEHAGDEGDGEEAEDVDLQAAVVDTMRDLDAGEGADRSAVIETVVEETAADEAAIETAIEDALMGGQCYEPDDETLKPI